MWVAGPLGDSSDIFTEVVNQISYILDIYIMTYNEQNYGYKEAVKMLWLGVATI